MTAEPMGHEAIAASAGSGKTFQLAHRYIRLLVNGVEPDRIAALTFSRKAAGEIFDSIAKYLREAASSAEQARQMGERIDRPELGQDHYLRLLRRLLNGLHRLQVGTLDSFTVGVVRTFPMELGISMDFQVLDNDGAEAKRTRHEVLDRVFDNRHVEPAAQREFFEAFRQATFGREEKNLERSLDTFIGEYRSYYQTLPARELWGLEKVLWPEGSPWLTTVEDVDAVADQLEELLADDGLSEKVMDRWHRFIEGARTFSAGALWGRDIEYLFEKLAENMDGLRSGKASIKIDRASCSLSSEECRLALALVAHVMKAELSTALESTRGIYRVLHQYEQLYDTMVRRRGRLTFSDAQYLLTEANSHSGGALLSRTAGRDAGLYIDYRLDCELDHWLLDEFQDTSDLQWEVLRNIADEILQGTGADRSFFYVGDVKQAIYGWRGGNAKLFGKILEQYGSRIKQTPLNTTFRSCQHVVDTVNQVFSHLPEGELPAGAVTEWRRIWQHHQCQEGVVPTWGYVALLEPDCQGGEVKPNDEDRYRVVAGLLKEINPLDLGLSVAILVRSNKAGSEIVSFLRRECPRMTIIHEGRAGIKDNPVVSVLIALVKFAAHPGDTFAWRHLEMSPLRGFLLTEKSDRDSLPLALLREIQTFGFEAFIRSWGTRIDEASPIDAFGRKRRDDLVNAAREFDEDGSRDCNAFLRFIDSYEIHELAGDDAVRVMTIHQSKGLGFDIVILPDLQGKSIAKAGDIDFATARDPESNRPLWALKMPRRIIAETDPVLAEQIQASDDTASFDSLCVLYVALTRARHGLYIVTGYPGKTAAAMTSAAFLKLQLAGDSKPTGGKSISVGGEEPVCLYETGERSWYTEVTGAGRAAKRAELSRLPDDFGKAPSRRRRLLSVSPSTRVEGERAADSLFARTVRDSLDFGTAIHELFSEVSWTNEVDIEELIRGWQETSSARDDLKQGVIDQFRRAVESGDIRQALSRPEGNVELWREKAFDMVLSGEWVSGVFDRVVIVRDPDGKPASASVLDFKTDVIAEETGLTEAGEHHRPQMSLYGTALSRVLQLDPSKITLQLVFTHPGKVYGLQ